MLASNTVWLVVMVVCVMADNYRPGSGQTGLEANRRKKKMKKKRMVMVAVVARKRERKRK